MQLKFRLRTQDELRASSRRFERGWGFYTVDQCVIHG